MILDVGPPITCNFKYIFSYQTCMQGITASRGKKILQEKSSKKSTPPSSTASWFSVLDSCSCGLSRPVGEPTKHSPFNIHFIEQHYRLVTVRFKPEPSESLTAGPVWEKFWCSYIQRTWSVDSATWRPIKWWWMVWNLLKFRQQCPDYLKLLHHGCRWLWNDYDWRRNYSVTVVCMEICSRIISHYIVYCTL